MTSIAISRWSGTETCAHCLQTHSIALERRCVVCDGTVCVFCIETHTAERTLRCAECAPKRPSRPRRRERRR